MPQTLPALPANTNAEKILREAWLLFQSRGYRGASMDEVCRLCRITKPTLYYYFRNKETLYIQTMLHQLHGYRAIVEQNVPLPERLRQLAQAMLDNFSVDLSAMLRDVEHIHDKAYRRLIRDAHQAEIVQPVMALMQTAVRSGELRPGESAFYTWAFFGLVNTFIQSRSGVAPDSATRAQQIVELFWRGAGA